MEYKKCLGGIEILILQCFYYHAAFHVWFLRNFSAGNVDPSPIPSKKRTPISQPTPPYVTTKALNNVKTTILRIPKPRAYLPQIFFVLLTLTCSSKIHTHTHRTHRCFSIATGVTLTPDKCLYAYILRADFEKPAEVRRGFVFGGSGCCTVKKHITVLIYPSRQEHITRGLLF